MREILANKPVLRDVLLLAFITLVMVMAAWARGESSPSAVSTGAAPGASVRLKSDGGVSGDTVFLSDVAELKGDAAAALNDVVVGKFDKSGSLTVTMEQVRAACEDRGVNWGRLSLGGYPRCNITRSKPVESAAAADAPAAVANPASDVGLGTAITLRDRVVTLVEQYSGVGRDELKIVFDDRDAKLLGRSVLGDRLEFEPLTSSPLGRVPIVVRRYDGDRLTDTWRLSVDVSHRVLAAVVTKGLSRGQVFADGDAELREVYVNDAGTPPVGDLKLVVGQTAAAVLRQGAVIYPSHLRSPVLIHRGDLVTVRCISGALVIKTVGRAMDDGAKDTVIQVRNEKSRATYMVRVTAVQEGVSVADAGEGGGT